MEPAQTLERIAYLLDRAREKPYRVRAYLRAAEVVTTQLYIGRMSKTDIATRVPRAFTATYGRAI